MPLIRHIQQHRVSTDISLCLRMQGASPVCSSTRYSATPGIPLQPVWPTSSIYACGKRPGRQCQPRQRPCGARKTACLPYLAYLTYPHAA